MRITFDDYLTFVEPVVSAGLCAGIFYLCHKTDEVGSKILPEVHGFYNEGDIWYACTDYGLYVISQGDWLDVTEGPEWPYENFMSDPDECDLVQGVAVMGKAEYYVCDHAGCDNHGVVVCIYPDDTDGGRFCVEHCRVNGFCPGCGMFSAGIDDFDGDLLGTGMCYECSQSLRDEMNCGDGDD